MVIKVISNSEYKLLNYLYFAEKNINEEYGKIIDLQDVAQQSYDYMESVHYDARFSE